jgi:hypothetical protein
MAELPTLFPRPFYVFSASHSTLLGVMRFVLSLDALVLLGFLFADISDRVHSLGFLLRGSQCGSLGLANYFFSLRSWNMLFILWLVKPLPCINRKFDFV